MTSGAPSQCSFSFSSAGNETIQTREFPRTIWEDSSAVLGDILCSGADLFWELMALNPRVRLLWFSSILTQLYRKILWFSSSRRFGLWCLHCDTQDGTPAQSLTNLWSHTCAEQNLQVTNEAYLASRPYHGDVTGIVPHSPKPPKQTIEGNKHFHVLVWISHRLSREHKVPSAMNLSLG